MSKAYPYCSMVRFRSNLSQFSVNNPWTNMKELQFNSDQKVKVAYLSETTTETFQDLTVILIMPVLTKFNPISIIPYPQQG